MSWSTALLPDILCSVDEPAVAFLPTLDRQIPQPLLGIDPGTIDFREWTWYAR
jgi:hypothetical protein